MTACAFIQQLRLSYQDLFSWEIGTLAELQRTFVLGTSLATAASENVWHNFDNKIFTDCKGKEGLNFPPYLSVIQS